MKLTMTEAHSWDVPGRHIGGRPRGWPAILSSLKSVLETGKPLDLKMAPPEGISGGGEAGRRGEAVAQGMTPLVPAKAGTQS